jgi:hypothetical protein
MPIRSLSLSSCTPAAFGRGLLFIACLGVFCLAACSAAPVQEMSEARQAIEAARVAGAEKHAPDQYDRARSLLETAQSMLNERHFRKARENAALARDEAIQARELAQQSAGE